MSSISSAEYKAIMHNDNVVTIDIRTPYEVQSESIGSDLHINSTDCAADHVKNALNDKGLTAGENVYLLCQSGARAEQVQKKLGADFPWRMIKIEGGLNALKTQGVEVTVKKKNAVSLERQVRIAAGLLVVVGVVLAHSIHPNFIYLSAFVGAGLTYSGVTNTCTMALILAKMPWNK